MRIRYIGFQFCVIAVSVISDSVILVSVISDSYLVISDSLYLIPLYQNLLYQIHCGPVIMFIIFHHAGQLSYTMRLSGRLDCKCATEEFQLVPRFSFNMAIQRVRSSEMACLCNVTTLPFYAMTHSLRHSDLVLSLCCVRFIHPHDAH